MSDPFMKLKSRLYKRGYRPKLGSIFHSPSLALIYSLLDYDVALIEGFRKGMEQKVPLTLEVGGPVIGEATISHDGMVNAIVTDHRVSMQMQKDMLGGLSVSTDIPKPVKVTDIIP